MITSELVHYSLRSASSTMGATILLGLHARLLAPLCNGTAVEPSTHIQTLQLELEDLHSKRERFNLPEHEFTFRHSSFPTLLAILIPNFHGSEKNTLNIMEEDDPVVVRLRAQTQHHLKAPLLFLDRFAQKFWKYMSMWTTDENPFSCTQAEVRLTTGELRSLLDQDMADIERVENEIADELVVSAFLVNTGLVKQGLIKKKKAAFGWLDLEERTEVLNERQMIFKQPLTQTGSLKRLLLDIEPYKNLWFIAVECMRVKESLMKDSLDKIDILNLAKSVHDGLKVMDHCIKFFSDTPPIQHIAMEIKHLTETYKPILPVVEACKNPAIKSRHWDEISKICGYPVYPKTNEPFKRLLDKGILEKADLIVEIARSAIKETEIITAIDMMEHHISGFSIRVNTDESTEVQIVQLEDEALEMVVHCLNDTED